MPVLVNIFLLLLGGVQGIILLILLWQKKAFRSAYIFLFFYMLVLTFHIVVKAMSKSWMIENTLPLYLFSYEFAFLYGPLAFLFCSQLLFPKKLKPVHLLHFFPFILLSFYYLYGSYNSGVLKIVFPFFDSIGRLFLQLSSIIIYHILALKYLHKHRVANNNYESGGYRVRFKWLRQFFIFSFIISSIAVFVSYCMYKYYPLWNMAGFGFVLFTIFIYWVSYVALKQSEVFSVVHKAAQATSHRLDSSLILPRKIKYARSNLQAVEAERILKKLDELILQKIYLDADLNIDKLSMMLNTNRHHLSQVINEKRGKNFFDYLNEYRVEEAKMLLISKDKFNHKIAAIAYDSGFNSLSNFNEVFKKITGQTPSQYRLGSKREII